MKLQSFCMNHATLLDICGFGATPSGGWEVKSGKMSSSVHELQTASIIKLK